MKRTYVHITERTYYLTNPINEPVAFLVERKVLKGWHIDSDPQPVEMNGDIATFRVVAMPGQTVQLHVGQRK